MFDNEHNNPIHFDKFRLNLLFLTISKEPSMQNAFNNQILVSLPLPIYDTWERHFEIVELQPGQVLYNPDTRLASVYFPLTAIVSWLYLLEDGDSTEIAMVGREGLVGLYLLLGSESSPNRAVVQTAGQAIRMPLPVVLKSFEQNLEVQRVLLRFAQTLINQMSQGNVCRQHHSLEQQICRMLLMIVDRQDSLQVHKTHEAIALLLGVRREAVSLAAAKLMKEGLISYTRGLIEVLDRSELEKTVCECYSVVQSKHSRVHQHSAHTAQLQTETI